VIKLWALLKCRTNYSTSFRLQLLISLLMLGRFADHGFKITAPFLAHALVLSCCCEPPQVNSSSRKWTSVQQLDLYTSTNCSSKFSTDPNYAGQFHSQSCDVTKKPPDPTGHPTFTARHKRCYFLSFGQKYFPREPVLVKMELGSRLCGCGMDGTGSGPCPEADFNTSRVEKEGALQEWV
jgi:hypothetical protein